MKHPCMRNWAWTIALLSLLATAMGQDLADFERRLTKFTLRNGMCFLVLERHEAPVVTCYTHADVGAADEVKGITGVAHLLEHLAFKGTRSIGTKDYDAEVRVQTRMDELFRALKEERRKNGEGDSQLLRELQRQFTEAQRQEQTLLRHNEFEEILKRAGGVGLNAETGCDYTSYQVSLPSNKLELWMLMESDRFLHPVLREFYQEKDVVMEERRQGTENRGLGRLSEEFLAIAYKAHPYGEPIVGHMSDLETLTRAEAREFFNKYYVASNLVVAIVGEVDPQQVKKWAQKYFGRLPCRPSPEPVETIEPPQWGERRVTIEEPRQPMVFIGYHRPNIKHPDDAVFHVIADIVGSGRTARLHTALVKEKRIAVSASILRGRPGNKYSGLFIFYAAPAKGHTSDECERAVDEEIRRLKNEPVNAGDLARAKTRACAGLVRELDGNAKLAHQLSYYEVVTGDWRNLFRQPERIQEVTAEDIQRVARTYFTVKNRAVGAIRTASQANSPGQER
jgi:predicted Zn-dependent peptidase